MLKGLVRLSVVSVVVIWISVSFIHWRELDRDIWLIEQHMSPHLNETPLSNHGWPAYAASDEFLSLSLASRRKAAEHYYDNNVKQLEDLYSVGKLREWIIETSQFDLKQAPIDYLPTRYSEPRYPYRRFDIPGIPTAPNILYVSFGSTTMLLVGLVSVPVILLIFIGAYTLRWIVKGFSNEERA